MIRICKEWHGFVKHWIDRTNSTVKNEDLPCCLCVDNRTSDKVVRSKIWRSLSKLNAYLKESTHTREEQLRRASKIQKDNASDGKAPCPSYPEIE